MAEVVGPTEPGTRKRAWCSDPGDLFEAGFEEHEYLFGGQIAGTAAGRSESVAPYRSRMLVRRPIDPAAFCGRVLVEWLNVSGGGDIDVIWPAVRPFIEREGWAYVGVTAQPVGVRFLSTWDPVRYASLVHPGQPEEDVRFVLDETFSDAVFSEAARVLRRDGASLLGAPVRVLVAHGQSQSAGRMLDYIGLEHPRHRLFDGYLVHAGGRMMRASEGDQARPADRDFGDARVLHVNSEAEVPRAASNRPPDSTHYRYWEVAGSGHTPASVMYAMLSRGNHPWTGDLPLGPLGIEYALRAAVDHLARWAGDGTAPPAAPPIEVDELPEGQRPPPAAVNLPGAEAIRMPVTTHRIRRDELGNALGGVRLPHIEAPQGRFSPVNGDDPLMPGFEPFTPEVLRRLYGSPPGYTSAVEQAVAGAIKQGWLLEADGAHLQAEAGAVTF
jgi:hypothetical protein